ncbi:hypothetical protein [Haloarchaeobius iranensis]|uniref:hypothetical protein n=1 Tax=Haloarchaeobius iranensis TaxID=996166 RepID=UPI000B7DF1B8|nr:hypothetical protein [Haloarchaeobius iranensis]
MTRWGSVPGLAVAADTVAARPVTGGATTLTTGYGGVLPGGRLASVRAGLEVHLSVVLGGLVVYALVKRSEV